MIHPYENVNKNIKRNVLKEHPALRLLKKGTYTAKYFEFENKKENYFDKIPL